MAHGRRRIHLNGFKQPTVSHTAHGLWRHPDSRHHRYRELDSWLDTARTLERGGFDSLFVADVVGPNVVYRGSVDQSLREGTQTPSIDPLLIVSAMAAVTRHLGFGITVTTTYEQPYALARKMTTLDHLTNGRIGWNVVTGSQESAARNLGVGELPSKEERYAIADEFMDVVYNAWERSWDDDAVVMDRERGVFVDPERVRPIGHHGRYFDVPDVFLCEPSIQRTPVIYQAGTSKPGRAFAAKHAEGIFTTSARIEQIKPVVEDIRARAAALGRDPQSLKFLSLVAVVVAPTDAEAQAIFEDYQQYHSVEGTLAFFSAAMGLDLGSLDPDQPLRDVPVPGVQGLLDAYTRLDPDREWTPRQIAEHAGATGRPTIVGSPATVADELERLVDEVGIDGFNLADVMPGVTFPSFVDLVVPELRRRGRVPERYPGTTLRESFYGPGRRHVPDDHPAAAYRAQRNRAAVGAP
ncbi:MAG: LLM class flavin-dependent oxidoreductase [Solirubrobacteraceae bacterium]|nr:LLM class flavin-dependent oxidoreductase [Solirubrobacteraceae bacterium]